MSLIELNNYSLCRQNTILLNNISLTIDADNQYLLIGESGSGKTSFCEALAGLLYASGEIKFNWQKNRYSHKISYVSQFSSFKDKTGMSEFYYQQRFNSNDNENTISAIEDLNKSCDVNSTKFKELINLFSFTHRLNALLLHLSSGERKKLQLIKTLLNPTQVILLDNPYIGLDKQTVALLNDYLAELANTGITFIIVSDYSNKPNFINSILEITTDKKLIKHNENEYIHHAVNKTNLALNISLPLLDETFETIIKLTNVDVAYGEKQVLSNVNWTVHSGDKWLLAGSNGAGKSTLLSLINGDHPQAYANDIVLFDKPRGSGETIWDIKRKIGYISPELHWNFDQSMTCLQVVLSGFFDTPGLYGRATAEQQAVAIDWLDKFDLASYAFEKFANVSGGIQRSMLLLRALIKNPPLFIFDEPCQGLDTTQSQHFIDLVDKLFADKTHTIIYVSHRSDEIPMCINKRITLEQGLANLDSL